MRIALIGGSCIVLLPTYAGSGGQLLASFYSIVVFVPVVFWISAYHLLPVIVLIPVVILNLVWQSKSLLTFQFVLSLSIILCHHLVVWS